MADKIDGLGQQPRVTPNKTSQSEPTRADAPERAQRAPSEDTVRLTDEARQLQELERTLESLPVVDEQRVADVKEAISSGQYTVDAESVAEKMLRIERGLPFVDPSR